MKKVFSSHSEVCHIWANRTQNEGKANNIFFEDNIIYSYGKHFELAKFIEYNNKVYLFVNTDSYSNSTGKHLNHVVRSINKSLVDKIFYFDFSISSTYSTRSTYSFYLNENSIISTVDRLIIEAKKAFDKQLKARENTWQVNNGLRYLNNAIDLIAEFYQLSSNGFIDQKIKIDILNDLKTSAINHANHLQATKQERDAKKQARKVELEKTKLERWLQGSYNQPLYNLPIYLRLQGDYIQTSHGAKVPKLEALQAFKRIKSGENIEGEKIGSFTVNKQENNLLLIGCHKIEINRVETFLTSLL
jgi:hypothetical protein